jgi:hypothetical protein
MSLPRILERWGIESELTHDQAALLGHEDANTGQQTGQQHISANDHGMLAVLGEQFAKARKPIEQPIAKLRARLEPLVLELKRAGKELETAKSALEQSRAQVRIVANRRGKIFLGLRRLPLWVYLPLMLIFVIAELILNSTALQIMVRATWRCSSWPGPWSWPCWSSATTSEMPCTRPRRIPPGVGGSGGWRRRRYLSCCSFGLSAASGSSS